MAGAGIAIDAAMFAATIGVYCAVKRQIRRAIVADGRARHLDPRLRAQHLRIGRMPTIGDGVAGLAFEPAHGVFQRATAARLKPPRQGGFQIIHQSKLEQSSNESKRFL